MPLLNMHSLVLNLLYRENKLPADCYKSQVKIRILFKILKILSTQTSSIFNENFV